MNVKTIKVGYLQTKCYIIEKDNEALIVDPGDEANKIIDNIGNLNVKAILVTHHHFDHIGGLEELKNKYIVDVIDYKKTNKRINIGDFSFEIIDTKGHTNDSITFYFKEDNIMFTGDFLFKESIGRTDFENSNYIDMLNSIKLIKTYNGNIKIYPGHGEFTCLDDERNSLNCWLN